MVDHLSISSIKAEKAAQAQKFRDEVAASRRRNGLPDMPIPTGTFGDGRPPTGKPENHRVHIDQVFGVDAPVIEGVAIEVGSGAKSVEWQLAEHVVRISREDGLSAAWAIRDRLLVAPGVNRSKFDDELVARNALTLDQKKGATAALATS